MNEKVSNLLDQMANYIEDPDGRVVLIAERDDNEHILNITTHALVQAAAIIRAAGKKILALEPSIDTESLDELAEVAAEFDNDEELSKYSDSIDNVLSIINKHSSYDDNSREVFENDVLDMSLEDLYKFKEDVLGDVAKTEISIAEIEHKLLGISLDDDSERERAFLHNKVNTRENHLHICEKKLEFIDKIINKKESESIQDIGNLAMAFDNSGDDKLEKIASVLDEILLTIGSPKGAVQTIKSAEETEIEKLQAKYKKNPEDLFTVGNEAKQKLADEYTKEIENKIKVYKPLEAPLSARSCPDHAGIMLARVGDHVSQCPLDKKVYNYDTGYTLMDGSKVAPGTVSNQTQNLADHASEHVSFSTREQKLNDNG